MCYQPVPPSRVSKLHLLYNNMHVVGLQWSALMERTQEKAYSSVINSLPGLGLVKSSK
jgi:hypothetical protein